MPFTGVKRSRNKVLLAKVEVTSGTAETGLLAADVVYVSEATMSPQPNVINLDELGGSIDQGESIVTTLPVQIATTTPIRGSGTAGTAPSFGKLLLASGMSQTIVATTSVTYAPISTPPQTLTFWLYEDGLLYKMTGSAGAPTLTLATGAFPSISANFTGTYPATGAKTDAANPTVTASPTSPLVWRGDIGGSFKIDTVAAAVSNFTLDFGNNLVSPEDPNASGGIVGTLITARNITGTINPLETSVATRDLFGKFRAGTTAVIEAVVGQTAGNRFTLGATIKFLGETYADDGGVIRRDYPFQVVTGTLSMVFT
jgi:hypothetical protein